KQLIDNKVMIIKSLLNITAALTTSLSALLMSCASPESSPLDRFESEYQRITGEANLDGLKMRLTELNRDIKDEGLLYDPVSKQTLLTGYYYGQFYDWDLYFESLYQAYNGEPRYCFDNLDAFFARQKEDGSIQRAFGTRDMDWVYQMFKPFVAQTALLGMRQDRRLEWLEVNFSKIERYLNAWYTLYDRDCNELCVWENCGHTGMDNQHYRVKGKFDNESVDLNCYLYNEWLALAELAQMLNRSEAADRYRLRAEGIAKQINRLLWNDEEGIYYDRLVSTQQQKRVKGISAFTPLYVGIASEAQAKRLIEEHLTNPDEYWGEYPVRTLAKSETGYNQEGCTPPESFCNWNGTTWVPFNYMIFHGLMDYGYNEVARELAYKTFEMVYVKNPVTREYFNGETGGGYGRNPFFGWSSLAYLMPLEYEMGGYSPSDLKQSDMQPIVKELLAEYRGEPKPSTLNREPIQLPLPNINHDDYIRYTYNQRLKIFVTVSGEPRAEYQFKALSTKAKTKITAVEIEGCGEPVEWRRTKDALYVSRPKSTYNNDVTYIVTIL
ncbi:MAG: trehalase family glycosidase, partial [Rikenellaceae bacterium]